MASSSLPSDGGSGLDGSGRPSRQDPTSSSKDIPPGSGKSPTDAAVPSNTAIQLETDGRWRRLSIDPAKLWVAYVQVGGGQSALRMELQLARGAPFALYGRRNAAPSITQHDFSQFVQNEETGAGRYRRQLNSTSAASSSGGVRNVFNISLVKPVEPGRWFVAVYNDDLQRQEVGISLSLTNEVATPCADDCNGRGQCLNGKCLCRDGFAGTDCSISTSSLFSFSFLNCVVVVVVGPASIQLG